jgi:hypothetical protein
MKHPLSFVAVTVPVRRSAGAEDSDDWDFLTSGVFIVTTVVVVLVLATTVCVAVFNWRAGRQIRNARKLAYAAQNHAGRRLVGEEDVRSPRTRR